MTEEAKLFSPSAYMAEMKFDVEDGIRRALKAQDWVNW
jgi:hypothetical protein